MIDTPLISIITPTYNQGQFIESTIKSVLKQNYPNIEYIIFDSMSTDNTHEILERYNSKISKIIREKDEGQSDAIIKGFKLAKGQLVGWINSDDILSPDCIQRIVEAYNDNIDSVLFYNSKINIISEDGSFKKQINVPVMNFDYLLRKNNTLIQPGSFYKKNTLIDIDFFDKKLKYSMDLDLWLRLLKVGDLVNVNGKPIASYREWDGTKTSTGNSILLRERKAMLLGHGANEFDNSIVLININLIKLFLKNNLFMVNRVIRLALFYGFARFLPASNKKYTKWCNFFRTKICRPLFLNAGKNINVEKNAFFGIGSKIIIGDNSGIGIDCKLQGKITLGQNIMMGPEVTFITSSHCHESIDVPMIKQGFSEEKPIIVNDDVWIGMRSIILPGVIIGKGVIIGAASVVTKNIPDYAVVGGNPARIIKHRSNKINEIE